MDSGDQGLAADRLLQPAAVQAEPAVVPQAGMSPGVEASCPSSCLVQGPDPRDCQQTRWGWWQAAKLWGELLHGLPSTLSFFRPSQQETHPHTDTWGCISTSVRLQVGARTPHVLARPFSSSLSLFKSFICSSTF